MSKPKVGFYWCASCGGCEEAIVDLNENILTVAELVDIVFWPCAMDFKYSDVKNMKDNEITIIFINGAIRSDEQEEMAKLLRKKSQIVISFGACSNIGGIPGLANFNSKQDIFNVSYDEQFCPSVVNPEKIIPKTSTEVPEGILELPALHETVKSLDQVIDVDYYLPGCSPAPYLTMNAIQVLLSGQIPPKGSYLAPTKALCDQCDRNETKPEKISIDMIKRVSLTKVDPEECLLAQGLICMGPVTRGGCTENGEGRCVSANMPCRGCYGPPPEVSDTGAAMTSALATILGIENEENQSDDEVKKLINDIKDPAGTFYRFSLPVSIFKKKYSDSSLGEQ